MIDIDEPKSWVYQSECCFFWTKTCTFDQANPDRNQLATASTNMYAAVGSRDWGKMFRRYGSRTIARSVTR